MLINTGVIILAGGKSSRMGKDKALLEIDDFTLIEYIVNKVKEFGLKEIILVTNQVDKYSFLDVKIVKDFFPGLGPLAGIHAGLIHSKYNDNFVIPCDMPFFPLEIIEKLKNNQGDCKVVVPKMKEKYQPLAAIYHKDCIEYIEHLLKNNESKVIKLYDLVKTCYLEIKEDNYSFFNINTPQDFRKAKGFIKEGLNNAKG